MDYVDHGHERSVFAVDQKNKLKKTHSQDKWQPSVTSAGCEVFGSLA